MTPLSIDVPTVLLVIGVITLFVSSSLIREWRVHRDDAPELGWWGAAYAVFALAGVLATTRVAGWQFVGIGVANALLATGNLMILQGILVFGGRQLPPAFFLAGPLWLFACATTPLLQSSSMCTVMVSIFTTVVAFANAAELWKLRHQAGTARDISVLYAFHGTFFLVRTVLQLISHTDATFAFRSWIFQVTLFELAVFSVIVGMYLLTMTRDRAFSRVRTASETDYLTGIDNRRAFFRKGRTLLKGAHHRPTTMLVFDLDHFKQINDRHGHAIGDTVLRLFCRVAEQHVGEDDVFGRLGGEEFAILSRADRTEGWERRAEAIREAFASSASIVDGKQLAATVSVGFASSSERPRDIASILDAADRALYRAKQGGRNRVEQIRMPVATSFVRRPLARVSKQAAVAE